MSSYTIGELAARTGFTASALRYYEGIGLVAPASRSGSGYRIYDDRALGRLAFIARAKQLGCSLEEIADLASLWDGERCGPVQRRFHELITEKIHTAQHHAAELTAFTEQLRAAAAQLSSPPTDGPCGEGCACLTDTGPGAPAPTSVALHPKPSGPPITCSLDADARSERVADWRALLDRARSRTSTQGGALRIDFESGLDVQELARLVAAEQTCCAFFSFALTVDGRGVGLEVRAPQGTGDILTALFGAPG